MPSFPRFLPQLRRTPCLFILLSTSNQPSPSLSSPFPREHPLLILNGPLVINHITQIERSWERPSRKQRRTGLRKVTRKPMRDKFSVVNSLNTSISASTTTIIRPGSWLATCFGDDTTTQPPWPPPLEHLRRLGCLGPALHMLLRSVPEELVWDRCQRFGRLTISFWPTLTAGTRYEEWGR